VLFSRHDHRFAHPAHCSKAVSPDFQQPGVNVIYDSVMNRMMLVLLLCGLPVAAVAAEPPALVRARTLYNAGSYDAAIDAATTARRDPTGADAAALVLARAHLERFRAAGADADLTAARTALVAVRAVSLSARDQVDLLIGLGQTLYFSQSYGPAADVFDSALGHGSILSPRDRSKLLDWWATALDRQAQGRPTDQRPPIFARIVERMEEELRTESGAMANYWLVVGARGAGDLDRAWDAAIAGWVRAMLGSESTYVRAELDRLVSTALIPERARARPTREQEEFSAAARAEWERVKEAWR
jgi:hypothetical protein